MIAIWIKTPPDAEPVWMAADNRIRALDRTACRYRTGCGWASANSGMGNRDCLPVRHGGACAGTGRTGVEERAAGCVPAGQQGVNKNRKETELPGKMRIGSLRENARTT